MTRGAHVSRCPRRVVPRGLWCPATRASRTSSCHATLGVRTSWCPVTRDTRASWYPATCGTPRQQFIIKVSWRNLKKKKKKPLISRSFACWGRGVPRSVNCVWASTGFNLATLSTFVRPILWAQQQQRQHDDTTTNNNNSNYNNSSNNNKSSKTIVTTTENLILTRHYPAKNTSLEIFGSLKAEVRKPQTLYVGLDFPNCEEMSNYVLNKRSYFANSGNLCLME